MAEAGFTSSSGDVRASLVNAKKGLSDQERTRNRSESSQVAQAGFGSESNAVTRGYSVATVYQHGRASLAPTIFGAGGLRKEASQTKDAERRDKLNVRTGKDTRSRQDP